MPPPETMPSGMAQSAQRQTTEENMGQITVDYTPHLNECGCAYLPLYTATDTKLKVLEKLCESRPSIGCVYYQHATKEYFHWFEVHEDYIRCVDLDAAKWLVKETHQFWEINK